jgi:hypothetical protein
MYYVDIPAFLVMNKSEEKEELINVQTVGRLECPSSGYKYKHISLRTISLPRNM